MSCLDLKRLLLNTGGLPGGEARWVAWSRVAAPELRAVAQRTRAVGHVDSEPLRATAPEHLGGYLEEEEERGGSLRLGVIAQGYGRLVGGGGTQ